MRKISVEGLQCTQAVMAVLREMVSMNDGAEIHISYEEPNARRAIMAMVKRRNYTLINEEEKLIIRLSNYLGNQMFMFAAGYATSKLMNRKIYIYTSKK